MEINGLLPIGSVVLLENSKKKVKNFIDNITPCVACKGYFPMGWH